MFDLDWSDNRLVNIPFVFNLSGLNSPQDSVKFPMLVEDVYNSKRICSSSGYRAVK
jgi:hypothetical protein